MTQRAAAAALRADGGKKRAKSSQTLSTFMFAKNAHTKSVFFADDGRLVAGNFVRATPSLLPLLLGGNSYFPRNNKEEENFSFLSLLPER